MPMHIGVFNILAAGLLEHSFITAKAPFRCQKFCQNFQIFRHTFERMHEALNIDKK
jgi:hypothetical protein